MNDALKKAREKQREMAEAKTLVVSYNPAQKIANLRAAGAKISISKAVKAKCWECKGGTATEWDPDIKKNIRDCTAKPGAKAECSLWEFRPYQNLKR